MLTPDASGFLFVVGGARSGKSAFAVEVGRRFEGPVVFVATATAGDADMASRIARHREDRPADWGLVEEPVDLAQVLAEIEPDAALIVDCLTMWVANALFAEWDGARIEVEAERIASVLADRGGLSVVVSNEVGLGIHPENELARRYQNLLGRVNTAVAARAATTLFFAAGKAVRLTDPWEAGFG